MTAPAWLREAFRDGVDERGAEFRRAGLTPAYPGADPLCFLADHDARIRPCVRPLERFHFIGRQRVRNALGATLPNVQVASALAAFDPDTWRSIAPELIELAEWDPRNGGFACEQHHRRFDSHMMPPLIVPLHALPGHVREFAEDWGLADELERKCPVF